MKKTIITILFALVAMTGQAKTFKTIKNPEAMACVNMSNGELKARVVIFRDTATTGIPHYETITPDCRRVRDDLRIDGYDNFDYEQEWLKEKLK